MLSVLVNILICEVSGRVGSLYLNWLGVVTVLNICHCSILSVIEVCIGNFCFPFFSWEWEWTWCGLGSGIGMGMEWNKNPLNRPIDLCTVLGCQTVQ